jgi:hypothetical protein
VDPVSNLTLLSTVELEKHLPDILQSRLPMTCLSAFLHEGTHHWSFFSPVGTTLAFLALRARRRAAATSGRDPTNDEIWDVVDDLVRYSAGVEVLRPISEGLALFAEFDDVPGSARTLSEVMHSVMTCFLVGREANIDEPLSGRPLRELLFASRLKPDAWERKTNLLMQPLQVSREDGYLPGYLVTKALWLECWRRDSRLSDADLALQYMYSYFFNDYGLVAHLLNPDVKDISAINPIMSYVVDRIQRLPQAEHGRNLDMLESAADLPNQMEFEDMPEQAPIEADPKLWELGRERFRATLGVELDRAAESTERQDSALARRDRWALAQRELLRIGREDVTVRFGERGWTTVWKNGRMLYGGPGTSGRADTGTEAGTLEVFVNPWRWGRYVAFAVWVDEGVVLTWLSRELTGAAQQQFEGYCRNIAQLEEENRLLSAFVQEFVTSERDLLEVVSELATERLDDIYTQVSLGFTNASSRQHAIADMREEGFYPILGNLSLVRTLAWISVISRLGIGRSKLPEAFALARDFHGEEEDFERVLKRLRGTLIDRLGDPIVYDDGDQLLCCV